MGKTNSIITYLQFRLKSNSRLSNKMTRGCIISQTNLLTIECLKKVSDTNKKGLSQPFETASFVSVISPFI
jgi:hypothetical protein